MEGAIPIIVICSIGMAGCLAYMIYALIKALRHKGKFRRRNTFEIDEDSLTIKLGKKK